jgi:hypothetical protein
MMRMLELFSGSGIMGETFKKAGWDVCRIDIIGNPEIKSDIRRVTLDEIMFVLGGKPDFIWASPPCTAFSTASMGKHWTGGKEAYIPADEVAIIGLELVKATINLIFLFDSYYMIENPRGVLRKMPFMTMKRHTVTYCQYGEKSMKPTDLWTNLETFTPRPMCKNGMSCHDAAPRGSKTGTQGKLGRFERAKLPYQLCVEVEQAARSSLSGKKTNIEQVRE